MDEAPAAASHKHVGGISDEEEQEGTLFLYCAAQKECCTAPSCGAFGSCLGALYVLICDVLRSVPILAIVSYLVLGVGQGYFNTGLNSLVRRDGPRSYSSPPHTLVARPSHRSNRSIRSGWIWRDIVISWSAHAFGTNVISI